MRALFGVLLVCILGSSNVGCADPIALDAGRLPEPGTFAVLGGQAWTSTGLAVEQGQKLLIEEAGYPGHVFIKSLRKQVVTAKGTYLFDGESAPYPLEKDRRHDDRRYPGYCLIGRIGDKGEPFFVGSKFRGVMTQSGMLWLGINDPNPGKNQGSFHCRISENYFEDPLSVPAFTESDTRREALNNPDAPVLAPPATPSQTQPRPLPDANVVIFYVDGLRPDVAVEMAQWGHMPYFNKLFLENGTWIRNSFSVQPSLTLTNFTSMITGVYAHRHGVKMQSFYCGSEKAFISGLSVRSFTRFADEVKARQVKAIWDYFPDSFAGTALPFQPLKSNVLHANLVEWAHRAVNVANYSSNIRNNMDEVQTRYALDLASSPIIKVMMVWLPSNDVASEHTPHGQFGGARPTIARMDEHLGRIVEQLKIRNRFENTYFILVSDHGHSGGHDIINRRFDVKREVFHAHLQMNVVGAWHRFDYPGAPEGRLGYVSDSDGAVGIFLPVGFADSGDFSMPNTFEQLAHYGLVKGGHMNVMELFAEYSSAGRWPLMDTSKRPVDFAVARVNAHTVLLHKTDKRQALIHARCNASGIYEFKYEPVKNFALYKSLEPILNGDPLGYLDSAAFIKEVHSLPDWLGGYHTAKEWLQATYKTEYPGCVDTLSLYFRWDGPVNEDSPLPSQPSILLFASKGWVFEPKINLASQHEDTIGSRHGMAFREATNHCFFVSGPGIKRGVIIETPHRMVDVLPTVLEMAGRVRDSHEMDGCAIREIWDGIK